jgi:hypothetical protein
MAQNIGLSTSIDIVMERITGLVSRDSLTPEDSFPHLLVLLGEIKDILKEIRPLVSQKAASDGPYGICEREGDVAALDVAANAAGWEQPRSKRKKTPGVVAEPSGSSSQAATVESANSFAATAAASGRHKPQLKKHAGLHGSATAANTEKVRSETKRGKVTFNHISKDIAEAEDELIIVMTNSKLHNNTPELRSLAKKFGAPVKSTGLDPEIGSIVMKTMTETGKQISTHFLVDKQTHQFIKKINSRARINN